MNRREALARLAAVATGAAVAASRAAADDKKGEKAKPGLAGTWAKKDGEPTLEFRDKDVLRIRPHGNDAVVIVCRYSAEKAGRLKAKVTDFEGGEDAKRHLKEVLPVGSEFRFKCEVKGDGAKVGGFTGDKAETLKGHLEGDYERKK